MNQGAIIDATLIAALRSTKKKKGKRDPEMHWTSKGEAMVFGLAGPHRRGQ